jgi:hypothetical protein
VVVPLIPKSVGVAETVNLTIPLVEGFQLQITEKFDPDPVADLFIQPGIDLLFTLKVTFEATEILAVIAIEVRYVAVVTDPARATELNADVSIKSVTVIVIACVPIFAAPSSALMVIS